MASDRSPLGIIDAGQVTSITHFFTASGLLGLDIGLVFPGETKPTILRVTMSRDQLLSVFAEIEATRQQLGFPLPAVFSQQQTRQ